MRKGNNTDVLARRKCTGARANREARRRESWARDAKSDNAALGPTGRQVGSARGRVLLARRGPGRAGSGSADWNGGGPGAAGGNITMRPVMGVGGGQPGIRPIARRAKPRRAAASAPKPACPRKSRAGPAGCGSRHWHSRHRPPGRAEGSHGGRAAVRVTEWHDTKRGRRRRRRT